MKISKWFLLLIIIFVLISCSSPQPQTAEAILTPSVSISTETVPFLDFDHPRLHEIAGNNPLVIDEIIRNRPQDSQGVTYVGIIVETGDPIFKKKMLLFQINKSKSELLYESDAYYYLTFNIIAEDPLWLIDNSNFHYYKSIMGGISQFASNYLEVPFVASNGGNCYDCSGLRVIGILENGLVKDITPDTYFTPKTYIDINNNLQFKIIATRYYESDYGACARAASPFAFRLFAWKDSAYVDVSEDEKEFYDQKISELTTNLQTNYNKPLASCTVMPTLANIFFNYESSGRVDEGWEQINSLGDLSHWDIKSTPPEEIKTYHEVFDELEQRKNVDQTTPTS
ncbi:MAG: hypothetical protein U0Z26_00270 [Anaerolineales bacterium]